MSTTLLARKLIYDPNGTNKRLLGLFKPHAQVSIINTSGGCVWSLTIHYSTQVVNKVRQSLKQWSIHALFFLGNAFELEAFYYITYRMF